MTIQQVAESRATCPLYCTINHERGIAGHAHLIAEVEVPSEDGAVTVHLVRSDEADRVELVAGTDGSAPTVARMTADEARTLRDALNVAVVLLDRT